MELKQAVLDVLNSSEKPLRTGDIAKKIGADSKEVSKVIKELRKEGKVHSPKRCYYAPK